MLNNTHSNFSPINTLNGFTPTIPAYSFDMDVFSHDSTERAAVEAFIKKGFFTAYQAKVNISAPWLLAIKKGTFKAALGIRSASTETLFIEQYLSSPIECVLNEYQSQAARNEIAEICHLFSSSKKLTLPLLMTAAVSLYCRHYKYMVFAGTEHVLNLIKRTGVVMTHLAPAKQDKLIGNFNCVGA